LSIAESKDRARKCKSEEVSDTKESEQNIASELKTEQKEEQKEKEEQELAERSKQEGPEEIEVSDTNESEQNIASEQKTEQKEEQKEEQDLVEGSKQEEPEEINSLDTEESEQNVASEQKREQKEEQKGKQEQDLAERSKQEEPEEIEVSDTKESKQNIASEQKMEQKEKEQDLVEQSKQEPEENEASEHKAEDKKGDGNGELKQGPKQVLINRAPVLTLWVAVVAEREGYTFEEGLSFGKFISGLFARTKGKRIGIFDDEMESEVQKAAEKGGSKNQKKRKLEEVERFEVFGMKLPGKRLENGFHPAVQNGKPIYPNVVNAYLHRASGVDFDPVKGKKCFRSTLISSTIFIDFCSNLLTMMLQKNASVADYWLRFLIV
jgi:hypothetical protein